MKQNDFIIKFGILKKYVGVNKKMVVIPKGIYEIGKSAFYGNSEIEQVIIPPNVTKINACAFKNCTNLSIVYMNTPVLTIGKNAFAYCHSLKVIDFGLNNIYEIGEFAFRNCPKLCSIIFLGNATRIMGNAFWECRKNEGKISENGTMRAFKAFKHDWSCKGFQYEVGKTYHIDEPIKTGRNGFHVCSNPLSLFDHYCGTIANLKFAEVEISGTIDNTSKDDKIAASDITIIRELSLNDLINIFNQNGN